MTNRKTKKRTANLGTTFAHLDTAARLAELLVLTGLTGRRLLLAL